MKAWDWVKAHPYMTAGVIVVGGVAIIAFSGLFRGNGGGNLTVASTGPSDAQLAASAQVSLAQIAAGAGVAQSNNEVSKSQIEANLYEKLGILQHDTDITSAQYGYQLGIADIGAGRDVSLSQIGANTQIASMAYGAQNLQTTTTGNVDLAQIDATKSIVSTIIDAFKPQPAIVVAAPAPVDNRSVWQKYLDNNPDVLAWAQTGHGDPNRPIDTQTLEDRAAYQYFNTGQFENRSL